MTALNVQLRDIWLRIVDDDDEHDDPHGSADTRIDALAWLGRATLDVIGLAGTVHGNFFRPCYHIHCLTVCSSTRFWLRFQLSHG